jgi:glycosyltransferase involved in cell wall biosynthesis
VSRTRRILIFAYFFPPLGGAGVQRIAKFARYLPDEGWRPTVVTVRARDYWMDDPSLEDEMGPGVSIVRTRSLTGLSLLRRLLPARAGVGGVRGSGRAIRALRGLASWACIPDSYVGWVPFAVREGERLLRTGSYDRILTTSSPDSAHLIGLTLAERHGVPWVADFRDPWVRRLSFRPPTALHRRRQEALERKVLERASLVTVTSEATREDYLGRHPDLPPGRIEVVTNGFDEHDFDGIAPQPITNDMFTVLHAGQLNPERPAAPFLEGLALFLTRNPEARLRTRVTFLGPHYAGDREAALRLGVDGIVAFDSGRPHRETVRELLRSHILLLMEQDSERGGLILPGKVFEYLRARRPILGLLPPGAAWDLIASLGAGICCRTGDREACASALERFFSDWRRGGPAETGLGGDTLGRFERRALTRRLASLLDRLGNPQVPSIALPG